MSDSADLSGKFIAQRYIYRFSPTKSEVTAPYAIEERQYYSISEDRTSLEPCGDKRFFFRADDDDGGSPSPPDVNKSNGDPRTYTRIGPSLYKMVHNLNGGGDEDDEDSELGLTVWNASFAMVLYCMANPHLIQGNVLELGSGIGIGSILSCIGAGIAVANDYNGADAKYDADRGGKEFQSIEDIGMAPTTDRDDNETGNVSSSPISKSNYAPVPPLMKQLTLTDSSLPVLKKCVNNIKDASFPPSKVDIHPLDWNTRVPMSMVGKFDCILACECAYYFPLVAPLSRTMAYSLRTSPYDDSNGIDSGRQKVGGQFLHVGPEHRDSIRDLRKKLSKGYRMVTTMESLVLERFDLVPLVVDSLEQGDEQAEEDTLIDQYAEYQSTETSRCTSLIGYHHEDYDGFNGEYFFPVEMGNEGNYGSDGKALDLGDGTDGDSGGGQWLG